MAEDNPFLALFETGSSSKFAPHTDEQSSIPSKPLLTSESKGISVSGGSNCVQKLNGVIEDIFCFTLNPYGLLGRPANDPVKQSGLVILESVALELQHEQNGRTWLGLDILSQALFERLLMTSDDLRKSLIVESDKEAKKSHATESLVIAYLAQAFYRAHNLQQQLLNRNSKIKEESDEEIIEAVNQIKALVVQNSCTAYSESELYHGQDLLNQTIRVFETYEIHNAIVHWFEAVTSEMAKDGSYSKAKQITYDVLTVFKQDIVNSPFMVLCDRQVSKLQYFIKTPTCAKIFMEYNLPADNFGKPTGISFQNTLIGTLLSKSCLPLNEPLGQYDFFQEPSKQPGSVHAATEARIWTGLEIIHEMVYELFNVLFRSSDSSVQKQTLKWIQSCLHANLSRGKMWTGQQILLNNTLASDGFILNLTGVLLRFCHPLCVKNKILKVDPSYAWTPSKQLSEETFLLSTEADDRRQQEEEKEFNFITEIFFLTQKSLDLGLRVCHEKFVKMNQELGRHQQVYRESMAQQGTSAAEAVQQRMDVIMTKYLSLKAALLVPSATDNTLSLCASTGSWLTQIALNKTTVALDQLQQPKELSFPLEETSTISPGLYRIPEFVMENICEQLLLVRRFCPHKFEDNPISSFLDFILTFMGSPKWVKNPHLRARLAESLENLLPAHSIENASPALTSAWQRQALFNAHPHRHAIVPTLLSVFVDIETTGQAVEFEQKFGYRRPMYDVMKYIWSIPDYQEKFVQLAKHAEEHIEDEDAPLFLRFVNLLINDAIFLLDEALGYMKQIQEQQLEQSNWSSLPAQERAQNQSQLVHMGRLARYHNIMGTETIQMLDKLTEKIHQVFTHRTMVDRMSSMLNYFLVNLVGPKRKSFKVKNLEEFSFKPGEIVTDISKIYLNLKDCDSFLASISRDGRSYTPDLFKQATEVLIKIGRSDLVSEVIALDAKVQEVAKNYLADEVLFSDAPDHFLDSILSHLMTDPVRLPHSGMVVDRSTIARHLLSDQMDPFTRAPLTMEQLEPMDQLKEEIVVWMQRKRNESQ